MFGQDEEYEMQTVDIHKEAKTKRHQHRFRRCIFWAAWISFLAEVVALSVFVIYVGILSFLPMGYFVALLLGMVLVTSLQLLSLRLQKRPAGTSIISLFLSVILFVLSIAGISILRFTYKNIDKTNQGAHISTSVVSVYVKQDSVYENLKQLKGHTVGVRIETAEDTISKAVEQLEATLDMQVNVQQYEDYKQLVQALKNGTVDAILLDEGMMSNITEFFDTTFLGWARSLPENIQIEQDIAMEHVSMTKVPFIVYISGVDTRGNRPIADNALSDVNQIAVVNPVAKKILLINTPRDTYVALGGDSTKMDKLTHAGIYGINCSIDTLEALYDIEINYYVKVNFRSLVNIVDALGGVTVQSDYTFSAYASLSGTSYTFYKGSNYLTGDKALAFARHRYNLPGGDMQRGVHQQRVIQAILKKLTTASVMSNFTDVLTAITDNTKTNISSDSINELIQMQLKDMATWDIQTYAMFGNGLMGTLFAFGTPDKYDVLSAPEDQVAEIQTLIQQVMQAK